MTLLTRIQTALLCLIFMGAIPGSITAQTPADLTLAQAGSMPAWTVPVLRLVSATHVEPTTGVVLDESGMVLVPLDFASPGDEIIVLDGGTDIIRNGRPAKIIKSFPSEGLQVLSVPTLKRRGANFTPGPLENGSEVRLSAFPPAELIAEGKPPLDTPTTISIPTANGSPQVSSDTPLPNVSGALVDRCGNLVGYSSAMGVQSMSTTEFPQYQWKDTLIKLLEELQLKVRLVECQPPITDPPAETPAIEPEPEEVQPEELQPEEIQPEAEPAEEPEAVEEAELSESQDELIEEDSGDIAPPDEEETLGELQILPPNEGLEVDDISPGVSEMDSDAGTSRKRWLWLLGAVILLGVGLLVHRLRNRSETPAEDGQTTRPQPLPVADEAHDDEPLTPGLDSELLVFGEMTDGTAFEIKCPVSSQAINLLIGRGQADIAIESPAISRRHALLNGTADSLTLSDLGSSNGTTINGVPCLESETMYVNPGDTITTGNARFHYRITSVKQDRDKE